MVTAEPPRSAPPKLVTADELLRMSKEEFHGELIRGELCEVPPPGFLHERLVAKLIALLLTFAEARQLGLVVGGSGVWTERDPDTVRAPDVQFYSVGRVSMDERRLGYLEIPPDLAVEVRSPRDSRDQVHDKAIMWLTTGVRMVWVVLPERRSIDVYRTGEDVVTITDARPLEGLDVLPGFNCSLEEIFGPAPQVDEPAGR